MADAVFPQYAPHETSALFSPEISLHQVSTSDIQAEGEKVGRKLQKAASGTL